MPKTQSKAKKKRRSGRRAVSSGARRKKESPHLFVVDGERTTHVLVPIEEYEELVALSMVESAETILEDPNTKWYDADEAFLRFAGDEIAAARKAAGLTQAQLARKLGVPQSQISRIERNPDRTTVRTLKKIANALGVDVSALVH